jgi:hypothetical protein
MESVGKITYQNKTIFFADYTEVGADKVKTIQTVKDGTQLLSTDESGEKRPPHSVLALANVTNVHFDMEVLRVFQEQNKELEQYYKKLAVVGVVGLLKAGYHFVIGLSNKTIQIFNTEQEAKDWLIKD